MTSALARDEKWVASLAAILLIALSSASGGRPAGVIGRMNTRGMVSLNGVAAPDGSVVYARNRISTDREAAAHVVFAHGGKLVIEASTVVSVNEAGNGYAVALEEGLIGAVSTPRAPILVETHGITIHENGAGATFEVEIKGNSLRVASQQGEVFVEASNRTVKVDAGKLLDANVSPETPGSRKKTTVVAVLTGVAVAGTVTGIALTYQPKSCESVSPSALTCP